MRIETSLTQSHTPCHLPLGTSKLQSQSFARALLCMSFSVTLYMKSRRFFFFKIANNIDRQTASAFGINIVYFSQ